MAAPVADLFARLCSLIESRTRPGPCFTDEPSKHVINPNGRVVRVFVAWGREWREEKRDRHKMG